MLPHLSPPGWALSIIAVLTILMQAPNIFDPSKFMAEFKLTNKPAAQLIGEPPFRSQDPLDSINTTDRIIADDSISRAIHDCMIHYEDASH